MISIGSQADAVAAYNSPFDVASSAYEDDFPRALLSNPARYGNDTQYGTHNDTNLDPSSSENNSDVRSPGENPSVGRSQTPGSDDPSPQYGADPVSSSSEEGSQMVDDDNKDLNVESPFDNDENSPTNRSLTPDSDLDVDLTSTEKERQKQIQATKDSGERARLMDEFYEGIAAAPREQGR